MGPTHASNSPPNASSSDSAHASPMGLSANISQSPLNKSFRTPVEAGTSNDYEEDEVVHPATTPEIRVPAYEDKGSEDDVDQGAQTIDNMDHESKAPVSGDTAEETRPLPMVDRHTPRTSQTLSASALIHQDQISNQDQNFFKQSISPTPSTY
jgi:hypothetical protein